MPKQNIFQVIYLTARCNLTCKICCREKDFQKGKQQLSYADLRKSLKETRFYQKEYVVHKCYTGGEPTLWSDGRKTLVDLLVETTELGFFPMLITNGTYFAKEKTTEQFVKSFLSGAKNALRVVISADYWHGNVNENGKCTALDNLLAVREKLGGKNALSIGITWTCSTRPDDLPPQCFLDNYVQRVDFFQYFPFAVSGRGHALSSLAPKLRPECQDKETLGAFSGILCRIALQRGWIKSRDEFQKLNNSVIMNDCTATPTSHCLSTDSNYYICPGGLGQKLFKICRVGEMHQGTMADFFKANPAFKLLWRIGPCGLMKHAWDTSAGSPEIMARAYPFGIGGRYGCALHHTLINHGIFQKMNMIRRPKTDPRQPGKGKP